MCGACGVGTGVFLALIQAPCLLFLSPTSSKGNELMSTVWGDFGEERQSGEGPTADLILVLRDAAEWPCGALCPSPGFCLLVKQFPGYFVF